MITSSRQLMDRIKRLVGADSTKAQAAMRLYAMERFLDRLARSPWRRCLIVKGGTLVTALVGVSMRTTIDIDATARGITRGMAKLHLIKPPATAPYCAAPG